MRRIHIHRHGHCKKAAPMAAQAGYILPAVLSLIIAVSFFATALLMITINNFFVVGNNVRSQQAFNIAEAGVNYYLWHMAHNGTDYKDGQSTPTTPDATLGYGPYVHTYTDSEAVQTGTFTLWIKPQGNGSTIATVRSIGKVNGSNITRTVEAQIGAASFASYGLVSNEEFWFGSNEAANGPVFSNVGIHMDGANSDTVGAANATYVPDSAHGGNGSTSHSGVWCSTTVTSPVNCSTRDKSNWLYPKSSVDFNQVSNSLCLMKQTALGSTSSSVCSTTPTTRTASYVPQYSTSGSYSVNQGYLIQLNANNTYDLYKVSAETDTASTYSAALTKTAVATGIAVPSSGVIFVEDNVWIRTASAFTSRVTIASGRLATNYSTNITIADNVLYSAKDGSAAIGLVAENNVVIAPYAPGTSGSLEVDAAMLAMNGYVSWQQYYEGTSNCTKGWTASNQTFTSYGSIASKLNWTWNFSRGSSCGSAVKDSTSGYYYSGIMRTTTSYDYNMLYSPPPSYPVTGTYNILSWREVLTKP